MVADVQPVDGLDKIICPQMKNMRVSVRYEHMILYSQETDEHATYISVTFMKLSGYL